MPDDQMPSPAGQAPEPRATGVLYFGEPAPPRSEFDARTFIFWKAFHEHVDGDPALSQIVASAATAAYEALQDFLDRTIGAGQDPQTFMLARHAAVTALLGGHVFLSMQRYIDAPGFETHLENAQNALPVALATLGRQVAHNFLLQRKANPGADPAELDPEIAAAVAEAATAVKN